MNIFVGNLSPGAGEDDLRRLFAAHGEVASVSIVRHPRSGRSRRFGFVLMPHEGQAKTAVGILRRRPFGGRPLTVAPAAAGPTGAYLMDVQDQFSDTAR